MSNLGGIRTEGAKRKKLGNVLLLIFGPGWYTNQLYKSPNIDQLVPFCTPCIEISSPEFRSPS